MVRMACDVRLTRHLESWDSIGFGSRERQIIAAVIYELAVTINMCSRQSSSTQQDTSRAQQIVSAVRRFEGLPKSDQDCCAELVQTTCIYQVLDISMLLTQIIENWTYSA